MAANAPDSLIPSSWADLLFSPRAAWLFDASAGRFLWGSACARERFGADLANFAEQLPRRTLKRLKDISRFKRRPLVVTEPLVLAASGESLPCRIEGLCLADGSTGLIIRDARGETAPTPQPAIKLGVGSAATPRVVPLRHSLPAVNRAPRQLSPEEEVTLRAIARRVRRLCRAKQANPNSPAPAAAVKARNSGQAREPAQAPEVDWRILHAFDALAELDGEGRIRTLSGRLCRSAGWPAEDSAGTPFTAFAQGEDNARIEALIARLRREPGRVVSADLLLRARDGAPLPCRVVAGVRSKPQSADNVIWAAIISLKTSRRMLCALLDVPSASATDKRAA